MALDTSISQTRGKKLDSMSLPLKAVVTVTSGINLLSDFRGLVNQVHVGKNPIAQTGRKASSQAIAQAITQHDLTIRLHYFKTQSAPSILSVERPLSRAKLVNSMKLCPRNCSTAEVIDPRHSCARPRNFVNSQVSAKTPLNWLWPHEGIRSLIN